MCLLSEGFRSSLVLLISPARMRIVLRYGNWSQHVLIGEAQPDFDFHLNISFVEARAVALLVAYDRLLKPSEAFRSALSQSESRSPLLYRPVLSNSLTDV